MFALLKLCLQAQSLTPQEDGSRGCIPGGFREIGLRTSAIQWAAFAGIGLRPMRGGGDSPMSEGEEALASGGQRETSWVRIFKGGKRSKADNREVDENAISAMLEERFAAKASKKYTRADAIAAELQGMGICYQDETHEWYTKIDKKVERVYVCTCACTYVRVHSCVKV